MIYIDFETRGVVNLQKHGVYRYVNDPDTSPWCMAYYVAPTLFRHISPGAVDLWLPGEPFPKKLEIALEEDPLVVAHNAKFEYAVWNYICHARYGWPPLGLESVRCTMAQALAMGLPPSLKGACAALGVSEGKDLEGHGLMMTMSKPVSEINGVYSWRDSPEDKQNLYKYCKQDVIAEYNLDIHLNELSRFETEIFKLDIQINEKGIGINVPLAKRAHKMIGKVTEPINAKVAEITKGAVRKITQSMALKNWCNSRIDGFALPTFSAKDIKKVLGANKKIPNEVSQILNLRLDAAKYSVFKVNAMLDCAQKHPKTHDYRAQDLLQYHGGRLGRWAGRRIQPHNLPKSSFSKVEVELITEFIDELPKLRLFGKPLDCLSQILRSCFRAREGYTFVSADFVSIEAAVLATLAGDDGLKNMLLAGEDIYAREASILFSQPITKKDNPKERFIGKIMFLALQYQGGISAFAKFSDAVDGDLFYENVWYSARESERSLAKREYEFYVERGGTLAKKTALAFSICKTRWRRAHPKILRFCEAVNASAISAVKYPGHYNGNQDVTDSEDIYWLLNSIHNNMLSCELPSGRKVYYQDPKLEEKTTPWGEKNIQLSYMSYKNKRWQRTFTYAGKICENICQAVARDILVEAMFTLDQYNRFSEQAITFHVHDQIVLEFKKENVNEYTRIVKTLLNNLSENDRMGTKWMADYPIKVETWESPYYL